MLLRDKVAVVHGATGAVGSAVARAFAAQGARVFASGRDETKLRALGASVQTARVDALDESAVERHLDDVVARAGHIDIAFNAIGIPQETIQGVPLTELALDRFMLPITTYARAHFVTSRAAARRMAPRGSGVILMHTPEPGRSGAPLVGGMGPAWAAIESIARDLSAEVASRGVRVACIRSTGMPETGTIDVVYGLHARALGIQPRQFQELMASLGHTKRQTTLSEVSDVAVLVASDLARGMTATYPNVTGGRLIE